MAYRSLYLRYRPQKFSEIKGQAGVVGPLRSAVRDSRIGHAYLLHGPRGSGKTSTARVLAKALNCADVADGDPCCVCESCMSIQHGRSLDLQELDAASNNKVDDMRALLGRVSVSSPGRSKVYLLDEVHMLTVGAENALLKTLEEPPAHVVWILATTELHKVARTVASRCQVFELGLVDADVMADHVRAVVADAGLDADDAAVEQAVGAGGGSVRDTLTAIERIAAGGDASDADSSADAALAAIADNDRTAALAAVRGAMSRGRAPRAVGECVFAGLRDALLVAAGDPPTRIPQPRRTRAADLAARMSSDDLAGCLEMMGGALIGMRHAADQRVDIEVAVVRLCAAAGSVSAAALVERVDRVEARLGNATAATSTPDAPVPAAPTPAVPAPQPVDELAAMQPASPTEVVEWARLYLDLGRSVVVARAEALQPDRQLRRDAAHLQALWRDLCSNTDPGSP